MTTGNISLDTWLAAKIDPNRVRESSPAGYHYLSLFRDNPRAWYLKYVERLVEEYDKPALLYGGVVHDLLEGAYGFPHQLDKRDVCDEVASTLLSAVRDRYSDPEVYAKHQRDLSALTKTLTATLLQQHGTYIVHSLEREFSLVTPRGYAITVRPDRILQDPTSKELRIIETKTTRWSVEKTYDMIRDGGQARLYTIAVQTAYPDDEIEGVIPEIWFHTRTGAVRRSEPGVIEYPDRDLAAFVIELEGTIEDLSRTMQRYEAGEDPNRLFPRSFATEYRFGGDWGSIYNEPLPISTETARRHKYAKAT